MLKNGNFYPFNEIVNAVIDNFDLGDEFCVYGDSLPLQVDGVYLIDDYPDVNDKDEEVYPEMAVQKGLSYLYSGQQLADVVRNVTGQIKNPKINEFKLALDFYSKNDNFMNFPGE